MTRLEYIRKYPPEYCAAMIAKLIIDSIEAYEEFMFPGEDCTFTQAEVEDEVIAILNWLKEEIPDSNKLN